MSLTEDRDLKPLRIPFANSYARLPENFYARVAPTPVTTPRLVKLNLQLADLLGLDAEALASPEGVAVLAGSRVAEGSEPLAMAYAGHQFGYFVRQLGDGRTNLLGEVVGRDGIRYDIQLKGSGRTPFSRNGDGRAAIGPVLREYIVSEAMATLGVPTTRSLAAVTTGQAVFRETVLPGAVLTRVAASHLRVGTFQYFFAQGDVAALRRLADYAIERHYSEAATATRRYRAFLDGVVTRQAKLVAQWMLLGFIHGVMNTDNTSISGETIDYGPCAFMEAYHPRTVFSSIDHQGRYSYSNQPNAMHWNLARLAETILPLLVEEEGGDEAGLASAYESLEQFGKHYEAALNTGMRRKLGLTTEQESDTSLIEDLLNRMMEQRADYTLTFRRLCDAAAGAEGNAGVRSMFTSPAAFDEWEPRWRQRLAQENLSPEERAALMRRTNPIYIPRNHLVEAALEAATEKQDFQPFEDLLQVLAQPYDERPGLEPYATPARPEEYVSKTFCGT
ncbi:YdiU family protein [Terriglobus albidus]|uniref:Protein nucleotidyltransferase YdiU n=1 Tax=Terriglobus albidus TaxID=1592106 RepID=A0A5B9EAI1_9BACT|nr:YdiU family protein [Terriglobus albidus]QEE27431.1 YdiU family protein [Terriglobus albidus]